MHYTPTTIPDEAEAAIAPAFDRHGVESPSAWVQKCRDDMAQLWRVDDCWAITEVCQQVDGRGVHIAGMAGDFSATIMGEIEDWARWLGCKKVYFTGRKGWLRRLPDYELAAVTCVKEL